MAEGRVYGSLGSGVAAAVLDEEQLADQRRNSSDPDVKLGQIYRDQWDDYLTRFVPIEDELIATYNNPEVHKRVIGAAMGRAETGFDAARGSYGRSMARYGMSPDTQVKAETERNFNLDRAGALVDAKNRTRQGLVERDAGMLAGGVTTGGMNKEVV